MVNGESFRRLTYLLEKHLLTLSNSHAGARGIGFRHYLEGIEIDSMKGPPVEINAKLIREILSELNLEIDFTPSELLRVWFN